MRILFPIILGVLAGSDSNTQHTAIILISKLNNFVFRTSYKRGIAFRRNRLADNFLGFPPKILFLVQSQAVEVLTSFFS